MGVRTTLNVEDTLFDELLQYTGAKTKTEAVHLGITEYIRREKIERLRALRGKVDISSEAVQAAREADLKDAKDLHL